MDYKLPTEKEIQDYILIVVDQTSCAPAVARDCLMVCNWDVVAAIIRVLAIT